MEPKIAIIGAGIAGLSAARKLYQKGLEDIVIFEASTRIGGRIKSIKHGEGWIELGAQWIHGQDGNVLNDFAVSRELIANPRLDYGTEGTGNYCTEDGRLIDNPLVKELISHLDEEKNMMHDAIENNQNVFEYFKEKFDVFINSQNDLEIETINILKAAFRWFVIFEVIDNSCDDLHDLSVLSYTEWKNCTGLVDLINFKEGYSSVIDEISKEFPLEQFLKLKTAVTKIEFNFPDMKNSSDKNSLKVKLSTVQYSEDIEEVDFAKKITNKCLEDSDIVKEDFIFDHVIITSSVGFLKENVNSGFFGFELPSEKVEVIRALGFGIMNKIYLCFEQPFWDPSEKGFQVLWLNAEDEHSYMNEVDTRNYNKQNFPEWVYCIQGFDLVRGQPNFLMAWIGSYGAKQMEACTDEEIGEVMGNVLRSIVPSSCRLCNIEDPSKVYASRWFSHPYVRGAYSNRTTNYERLPLDIDYNIDVLSQPIRVRDARQVLAESNSQPKESDEEDRPLILFAGEATDREHYSTTDGAMRSGEREGSRLFSFYYE